MNERQNSEGTSAEVNIGEIESRLIEGCSEAFQCPICMNLMLPPDRAPQCYSVCGHSICKLCEPRTNCCPICRQKRWGHVCYPNRGLLDVIWELKVRCKNKGCSHIGTLRNEKQHDNTCEHKMLNCEWCKAHRTIRKSMLLHKKHCQFVPTLCSGTGCREMVPRYKINTHKDECRFALKDANTQLKASLNDANTKLKSLNDQLKNKDLRVKALKQTIKETEISLSHARKQWKNWHNKSETQQKRLQAQIVYWDAKSKRLEEQITDLSNENKGAFGGLLERSNAMAALKGQPPARVIQVMLEENEKLQEDLVTALEQGEKEKLDAALQEERDVALEGVKNEEISIQKNAVLVIERVIGSSIPPVAYKAPVTKKRKRSVGDQATE